MRRTRDRHRAIPAEKYLAWDPAQPVDSLYMAMLKDPPPCSDPVWSPETDEEVMNETIAAMERWNMVGVFE